MMLEEFSVQLVILMVKPLALGKVGYPFIAIALRSAMTWSGSTCEGSI